MRFTVISPPAFVARVTSRRRLSSISLSGGTGVREASESSESDMISGEERHH